MEGFSQSSLACIDIVAVSPFAPYIMAAFSGILTAFIGLIVIETIDSVFGLLDRQAES